MHHRLPKRMEKMRARCMGKKPVAGGSHVYTNTNHGFIKADFPTKESRRYLDNLAHRCEPTPAPTLHPPSHPHTLMSPPFSILVFNELKIPIMINNDDDDDDGCNNDACLNHSMQRRFTRAQGFRGFQSGMISPRRRTAVHYRGPGSGENRGRNRDLTLPTDYFCQPGIREGSNGGGLGSKFSPGCFSPATDYLEVGLKQSSERRKKFASGLDLLCTSQKEESPRERGWCKAAITGGSGAAPRICFA
ncbi:hypothetical protein H671_1g0972 [Cricetulus griseus]|nr:hypothetical protein H671_1g0972 [Cricetulus griseus]